MGQSEAPAEVPMRGPDRHDPADPIQVVGAADGRPRAPGDRRRRRAAVLAVAAAVVAALAVMRFISPEGAVPPTTVAAPTTTLAEDPLVEIPWWEVSATPGPFVSLPGWEQLDPGPITGTARAAVAWTGAEILVWGAWTGAEILVWGGGDFGTHTSDGFIYDPAAAAWRPMAPPPADVCRVRGSPDAVPLGDIVVIRFDASPRDLGGGCTPVAAYRPLDDSWEPLRDPFFLRALPGKPLVWTGDLLVSPRDGLAHRWETAETFDIPTPPVGWSVTAGNGIHSAVWTGSHVVALGDSGVIRWVPGDDAWEVVDSRPMDPSEWGLSSAWTTGGLLVVDTVEGARFHDGATWSPVHRPASFMCFEEAVTVDTPMVDTCLGHLIWDDSRGTWVPIPPAVLGHTGRIVGAEGRIFSVGPGVHRLDLRRGPDGSIDAPATIAVGWAYLDLPEDVAFMSSFVSVSDRGIDDVPRESPFWQPDRKTRGVLVEGRESGIRCRVSVTAWALSRPDDWPDGYEAAGDVMIARRGLDQVGGRLFAGLDGSVAVGRSDPAAGRQGLDGLLVSCDGPAPEAAEDLAFRLAARMWGSDETAFRYEFTRGEHSESVFFSGVEPDRARTERTGAVFRECVEAAMPAGFALGSLQLLVDSEGTLLRLFYTGLLPGGSPPIAHVPPDVRDQCLGKAGVAEPFFEDQR